MSLGDVRRNIQSTPIRASVANVWDNARNDAQILNLLSTEVDNRRARSNPVRLEHLVNLGEARSWTDDKVISSTIDNLEWAVSVQGWSVIDEYNRVNVERDSFLVNIPGLPATWGDRAMLKELGNVMSVMRLGDTVPTWDEQPFWSATHLKLGGSKQYSNILQLTGAGGYFADPASPTLEEASAFLHDAATILGENNVLLAEATMSIEENNLLVIVGSRAMESRFRELHRIDKIGDNTNTHKGGFVLVRDQRPEAGDEDHIRVVNVGTSAGGARCVFRVRDKDPVPQTFEDNRVRNGFVGLGIEWMSGYKAGFPHVAVTGR